MPEYDVLIGRSIANKAGSRSFDRISENNDLSWMGPMKAEDANPEVLVMKIRLLMPNRAISSFSFPPGGIPIPRDFVACLLAETNLEA